MNGFTRFFADLGLNDVAIVGSKNASLGELRRHLGDCGVRVPNGFAIAADAYRCFLRETGWTPRYASWWTTTSRVTGWSVASRVWSST